MPPELFDLLAGVAGGLVGGLVAMVFHRRRRRAAASNAARSRPVTVPAAMRRMEQGSAAGRWRHGQAVIFGGEITWTPKGLLHGRQPYVLPDVVFGAARTVTRSEYLSLNPDLVILPCSASGETYELAILPDLVHFFRGDQPDIV